MDAPADGYDPDAMQQTWLPVWDDLQPFRSGTPDDPGPRSTCWTCSRTRRAICTWATRRPTPSATSSPGTGCNRVQRHAPHRMGRVRAAGRERRHQAGVDPMGWTYENIEQQKSSMRRYACSFFDWDRTLNTCDPEYYHWNQWLFLRMVERGLAYRKASQVNWCPNDQTVLANEQVIDGRCERCDAVVTKKKLTQWYLRITEYADRLLADMDQLADGWPEKVLLLMQRNWIGRSTGAEVEFAIEGRADPVTVYTTRPDTLYGATFFVVAADSDLGGGTGRGLTGAG